MAQKTTKKSVKPLKNTVKTAKNKTIIVKNAEGDPNTTATVLIQNKIKYTPKVSVIIPVYNTELYLRECLDSVVNQTLKEIEIICVDDGSTDDSLNILKEYAKRDNRITILTQKNLHAGVARNAGLTIARGEYIGFLDADDYADNTMYKKMYNHATSKHSDIVICKCANVDFNTKEISIEKLDYSLRLDLIPKKDVFNVKEIPQNSFDFSQGFVWDKLFKRKFIEKSHRRFQNITNTNDSYFTFSSLITANNISYLKDILVFKRHRQPKSLTANRDKAPDCFITTIDLLLKFMNKNKIYSLFARSFWNWALYLCFIQLKTLSVNPKTILLNKLLEKFKEWESYTNKEKETNELFKDSVRKALNIYAETMFLAHQTSLDSEQKNFILSNVTKLLPCNIYLKYFSEHIKINLAYAFDNNFALLVLTSIQSVIKNVKYGEHINFILMYDKIDSKYKKTINHIINNSGHKITWIHIDSKTFKNFPCSSWVTHTAWFRCLLPDLLPELDRILYLDSDTIVRHSLVNMFYTDLHDAAVGVIEDVSDSKKAASRLNLKDKFYFNSGVMLINCKKWQENQTFNKIKKFVTNNKNKIISSDQDTLNSVLDGKKSRLSPIYDYMEVWWRKNNCDYKEEYLCDYEYAKKDATIVHFTGLKPTDEKCRNSYIKDFYKYTCFIPGYKYLYPKNITNKISETAIPIVFASDKNYLKYTYITMLSCIMNTKSFIDFYIMIPNNLSSKKTKIFKKLESYGNCKTNIIRVGNTFDNCTLNITHITKPTYYRLIMADVLPEYYKKCIYLDADVIINGDIKEYFDIDLADNFIAGVKAAVYHIGGNHAERLHIPYIDSYINAGVTLWNLQKIRQENKIPELIKLSQKNYQSQDQDVVNIAFYGHIKLLSLKYNFMTKYSGLFNTQLPEYDKLCKIYGKQDVDFAKQNYLIVHYADKIKPWNNTNTPLADLWKRYEQLTNKDLTHHNIKPYIFFPYYMVANLWMKVVYIPLLKFRKHVKNVLHGHTHRGKMDMLNKNFRDIVINVQDTRRDLNRQISDLKSRYDKMYDTTINSISNIYKQIAQISEKLDHINKPKKTKKSK